MKNLGRLLRTVRHLQAGQIVNRLVRRLPMRPGLGGPVPDRRQPTGNWISCAGHRPSMLSPSRFRFLSKEAEIAGAPDWARADLPRLWLYNLHYFDDLLAEDAGERAIWHAELVARWIAENPPAGGPGWEPYPLSRRAPNWIIAALQGRTLPADVDRSLAQQARMLSQTIEYHLRGNHLFVNAKALIFLGCFFAGREAEGWLRRGISLLTTELAEQVLADGGHFELSPMYHALLLEDLLDLVQLAAIYPAALGSEVSFWAEKAEKMLGWLAAMSHPDGEISLFNDAAFREARNLAELHAYAHHLGLASSPVAQGLTWLRDTGYVRLSAPPWTVLFDAASVGPDYIPGHAHADTLSFELSLGAERIVTNAGTSTYDLGDIRSEERATRCHATVELDGEDSSEVWASFRVGRRARPISVSTAVQPLTATASHDGYRFLAGAPVHTRQIGIEGATTTVTDTVAGKGAHRAIGRFPLHPEIAVETSTEDGWRLRAASGRRIIVLVEGASVETEQRSYAPEFGVRQPRPVLIWQSNGSVPVSVTTTFRAEDA